MSGASGDDGSRDAAYAAWFDRMRNKKANRDQPEEPKLDSSVYWSPDALFQQSEYERQREHEELARRGEIGTLLARIGLPADATWAQVTATYKRLAKQHHPDAHVDATANTSASHMEEMMELNRVVSMLRSLMHR